MNNGIDDSTLEHSIGSERLKLIAQELRKAIEDDATCIDEFGKEVSIAIGGKVETYCVAGEATCNSHGVIQLFITEMFQVAISEGHCHGMNKEDRIELTKIIE